MRIRWKLLLLILAISVGPILLLRLTNERAMRSLSLELGGQAEQALLRRTRAELQRMVEDHARVLAGQRRVLEAALRLQAQELAQTLAQTLAHHPRGEGDRRRHQSRGAPAGGQTPCPTPSLCPGRPLAVDYSRTVLARPGRGPAAAGAAHSRPSAETLRQDLLTPIFQEAAAQSPELVMWQETALDSGEYLLYPAIADLPRGYDPWAAEWSRAARDADGPVWNGPLLCPITRQYVLTVSMAVRGPDGRALGVTSIAVPAAALVREHEHVRMVSPSAVAMLVTASPDAVPRLDVLARQHYEAAQMMAVAEGPQDVLDAGLAAPRQAGFVELAQDVRARRPGVRELPYAGRDCLWAYGPVDDRGMALLLVLPMADVTADAVAASGAIVDRIADELAQRRILLMGVLWAVALVALAGSQRMTRELTQLAQAARRLAVGDLDVRVEATTRDEVGDLARAFNESLPALREHLKIKQSLDLAREIQQGLLPAAPPAVPGLDIAGRSLFCEAVGGDYFGYLDCACGECHLLAAVGDVSGHGLSAALLMASARALLRSRMVRAGSLAQAVSEVNDLLAADTYQTGHFMTLFLLSFCGGRAAWVRAGHDPALLYDPAQDRFEELGGDGPALGLAAGYAYRQYERPMPPAGTIFCLATDGLWEARNPAGEFYGRQRLRETIRAAAALPAQGIVDRLLESLAEFHGAGPLEDDVTVVVVKVEAAPGGAAARLDALEKRR